MIGFKDRTWCASPNCTGKCGREFTDLDRRAAIAWWGGEDFPLSVAYFCDKPTENQHDQETTELHNT